MAPGGEDTLPVLCLSPKTHTRVLRTICAGAVPRQGHPAAFLCPLEHASIQSGPAHPGHPWDTEDRAVPEATSASDPTPRTLVQEWDWGRQLLGEGSHPTPAEPRSHRPQAPSRAQTAISHPQPPAQMCFSCPSSALLPLREAPSRLRPNGQPLREGGRLLPAGTSPKAYNGLGCKGP